MSIRSSNIRSLLIFGFLLLTALSSTSYALPPIAEVSDVAGAYEVDQPVYADSGYEEPTKDPDFILRFTVDGKEHFMNMNKSEGSERAILAKSSRRTAQDSCPVYHGGASYYADKFENRKTTSGELFKQRSLTAAHLRLPFGTKIRVTNEKTGRSVVVKVNDRGPHIKGRIVDLSKAAAEEIGIIQSGHAQVTVTCVSG